ncbi:MAG TPA: SDR family oxidoreductase [Dermatophilaceae bacterium]|nr:SDR family oxidoreductase [Dermatophilaceae bacterium]
MPTALITGASTGLGRALAAGLAARRWRLVIDARHADNLAAAVADLRRDAPALDLTAIPGSVTDPGHRQALAAAVGDGWLDLLVNNASQLGGSPQPPLAELTGEVLRGILEVNTVAPLLLTQALLVPLRQAGGLVVNISSDAAVAHYPGWGGYAASKAALDHLTGTLAAEEPGIGWYAVDPGDMRTDLHQAAFPGEDISDRPLPDTVVPAFLDLVDRRPPSGRYRAADLLPPGPLPGTAR